ncbi:InlB B-repeat-containing protein [Paenibacillus cymbidii]|uniref:InlB B-repeat-containing protein n=1 Tax=Paenibacillus cymbidii TaxID=1639034 RepID=UPI0010814813|nr:InlB B-repeat-containing protein [Paenibacillus cymbidii]
MANKKRPNLRFILLVAVLMSLVFPGSMISAYTHSPVTITSPASPIKVTVNGKFVKSIVPPKFIDGKIWVSAEAMAHYLYAVYYESIDHTQFVLKNDYYEMTATYGSNQVTVTGGTYSTITTEMPFKDGVLSFIPLDTIMYAFDAMYTWNSASNTAEVLYNESRHTTDEAAIPTAVPGVDITAAGKSRDGYYSIPLSDPNAEVTVWRKSADPASYVTPLKPRSTGYAWVETPKPRYNATSGAFEGGISYTGGPGNETIRVRIQYSDGITPDKWFKTSISTVVGGGNKIPDYDYLLRSTFNNISVYLDYAPPFGTGYTSEDLITYTLPVASPNTMQVPLDPATEVKYRKVGDVAWQDGLPLAFDAQNKNFRGSIVGLEPDTNYEVQVKVLNDNYTRTSTIKTWKEDVPIATTIPIASIYEPGKPLSIQGLHGTASGYIRIVGDGTTVVEVTDEFWEAVMVAQSSYVILENLIIRGGKRSGISVLSSANNIRIINCDISGFGREVTQYLGKQTITANSDPNLAVDLRVGQPYSANATPINNDSGIFISDASFLVIEKNFIHNAKTKSNAWNAGGGRGWYENVPGYHEWDEKHPWGVSGMYARGGVGVVVRYNDIVGSDDHRFVSPTETYGNHDADGGIGVDSDVYGNYFAYAQGDGYELEGSNMNVRFYNNKIEGVNGGIGMDTVYIGPLYVYRNLITNLGDEWGEVTGITKHGTDPTDWRMGLGVYYLFNNTMISPMGHITRKDSQLYRPYYLNNIIESQDSPVNGQNVITLKHIYNYPGVVYDYDLLNGASTSTNNTSTGGPAPIVEPHGITGVKTGVAIAPDSSKKATFNNRAEGDYSLTSSSLGYDAGTTIPNFVTGAVYSGAAPDIGAIESGKDVIVPTRPTGLRSVGSKYQVNITGNATQTVTISTYGVPTGTKYDLRKNNDNVWFTVVNASGGTSGTITEGVPLVLTVTGDPKKIGKNFMGEPFGKTISKGLHDLQNTAANVLTGQPAVGKGAFLVKLEDGLSLPISVYVTEGSYNATYTLTYKDLLREGDGVIQTVTVNANGTSLGSTVTPLTRSREGYVFLGWYDATYANKYDFSKPIEKNTVLYAKWQPV